MKLDKRVQRAIARRERIKRRPQTLPAPVQQVIKRYAIKAVGDLLPILPSLPPLVECKTCIAACCRHMGYPPFYAMYEETEYLDQSDPRWLELRDKHPELAAACRQGALDSRGDQELPCIWLDLETNKCKHHDLRPDICRDFEMGGDACLEHRERLGVPT